MSDRNWASSKIGTPRLSAFVRFEPAASPASKKSVFLLTDEEVLPPCSSMSSLACFLERVGRVPVSTKVLPSNKFDRMLILSPSN